jgi:hypothetical protein
MASMKLPAAEPVIRSRKRNDNPVPNPACQAANFQMAQPVQTAMVQEELQQG